ncbi:hypothetical protein HAX54_009280 [Datura stramonium]|uniref:Uncharacterized protein n=1 Tax=Datura stramonium TaxID=4076 RepID=A0ABS8TEL1_DATST|nr:hypothetical protein [Datura stramonium]
MAATANLAVVFLFFLFAILSLRCVEVQGLKGCPFKSMYQQFGNSISSFEAISNIDATNQRPSLHVNNNNNTRRLVTHDPTLFAQHQWLKNHVITMQKKNRSFYGKFIEAVRVYFMVY